MEKRYLKIEDLDCYSIAFETSNYVWKLVNSWEWFPKKTIGAQFVNSADSISANIAEGFGRYQKKDKIKFYWYSQGSLREIEDWNNKALKRSLINKEQHEHLEGQINQMGPAINRLIKFTNEKLKF